MRASEKAYYDRRAAEYDDWWLGTGSCAERALPGWQDEVARLVEVVAALPPAATLDVACGTGFLSQYLRGELTLLDQSSSMLARARERRPDANPVQADVPPLPFPDAGAERGFTSHFDGHLRDDLRADFVSDAPRVAGELIVVDSAGDDREDEQE